MHVLDLKPLDGSDPDDNFETVEAELREHGHGLADLPRLLALSKADLVPPEEAQEQAERWRERLGVEVFVTSAATGQGLAGAGGRDLPGRPPGDPRGGVATRRPPPTASTAPGAARPTASTAPGRAPSASRASAWSG